MSKEILTVVDSVSNEKGVDKEISGIIFEKSKDLAGDIIIFIVQI